MDIEPECEGFLFCLEGPTWGSPFLLDNPSPFSGLILPLVFFLPCLVAFFSFMVRAAEPVKGFGNQTSCVFP